MSPSCHFPPAPSPVLMSSLLADGCVAYFKPKAKFGLSYISLWCSHLRMYLPLLPVLGLSQLSWRITDPLSYSGPTPPHFLLATHQLEGIAPILASLYFVSAFHYWLLLLPELLSVIFCFPQQASVALFSAGSTCPSLITSWSPSKSLPLPAPPFVAPQSCSWPLLFSLHCHLMCGVHFIQPCKTRHL